MTPQEIFDTALAKVLEQGEACVDEWGGCFYQHPDKHKENVRCSVGWLMSDKELEFALANPNGIYDLLDVAESFKDPPLRPFFHENKKLLADIQFAHDNAQSEDKAEFVSYYIDAMKRVADEYNLEWKEPT